jgi:hypothetical protein
MSAYIKLDILFFFVALDGLEIAVWNRLGSNSLRSVCLSYSSAGIVLFFFFSFLAFRDKVSLCSLGYPETLSVDQAGLKLRNLPVFATPVLGLKACTITALQDTFLII